MSAFGPPLNQVVSYLVRGTPDLFGEAVQVSHFVDPQWLVEVEAIAIVA
jgi:hypothetical protein